MINSRIGCKVETVYVKHILYIKVIFIYGTNKNILILIFVSTLLLISTIVVIDLPLQNIHFHIRFVDKEFFYVLFIHCTKLT